MIKNLIIILIILFVTSCKGNNSPSQYNNDEEVIQVENISDNDDAQKYYEQTGEYPDGTYCSEVEYYNSSTGTRNNYSLDVEVEGGELTVIHWPNGGWLDNTHFYPEDITDGVCEFTSDKGYRYKITLQEFGGCGYTDEFKIRRDVNEEVAQTTCPKCGEEKYSYDDICDDCTELLEDEDQ